MMTTENNNLINLSPTFYSQRPTHIYCWSVSVKRELIRLIMLKDGGMMDERTEGRTGNRHHGRTVRTNRRTDGRTINWHHGRTVQTDEPTDRWKNGQLISRLDGWTDGWTDADGRQLTDDCTCDRPDGQTGGQTSRRTQMDAIWLIDVHVTILMDGRTDGRTGGGTRWTDADGRQLTDGRMCDCPTGRTDERMGGRTGGRTQMNASWVTNVHVTVLTDGQTDEQSNKTDETVGRTDWRTDGRLDRRTDVRTSRRTDERTDGWRHQRPISLSCT